MNVLSYFMKLYPFLLDRRIGSHYTHKNEYNVNTESIMKKAIFSLLSILTLLLSACYDKKPEEALRFGLNADYPPFEYYENGKIKGFDIDLAELISKELNKKAVFENMQFSTLLGALQSGSLDAVISTLTITEERKKNFDFSNSYYIERLAMVYPKNKPLTSKAKLAKKKIACQLGTTMEIWLKKHVPDAKISTMDNNSQAIEALKAGHVEGVLLDSIQAQAFSQKNSALFYSEIARSDLGYGIGLKKGSPLKEKINTALQTLEGNGELDKLKKKWFGSSKWKS